MTGLPTPLCDMPRGLLHEVVELFAPHTESDLLAVAIQLLVAFGNAVGRTAHLRVGETVHYLNEFVAIVGISAKARKGDSKNVALRLIELADPEWARQNVVSGLSSAEGLIYAVRDPQPALGNKPRDPGVSDKRLLVVESEFSSVLKQFDRTGNTLSPVLRDVWDGKPVLRNIVKNSPLQATAAHISIIAHTTPEDLRRYLSATDAANGLANRFMPVLAERSQLLPIPGRPPKAQVDVLASSVRAAIEHGRDVATLHFSPKAERYWCDEYELLTRARPGLIGSLLARSEPHVLRLSALFALLARRTCIKVDDLASALALWRYVEKCTARIFKGRTGSDAADRIIEALVIDETLSLSNLREKVFSNPRWTPKTGH